MGIKHCSIRRLYVYVSSLKNFCMTHKQKKRKLPTRQSWKSIFFFFFLLISTMWVLKPIFLSTELIQLFVLHKGNREILTGDKKETFRNISLYCRICSSWFEKYKLANFLLLFYWFRYRKQFFFCWIDWGAQKKKLKKKRLQKFCLSWKNWEIYM